MSNKLYEFLTQLFHQVWLILCPQHSLQQDECELMDVSLRLLSFLSVQDTTSSLIGVRVCQGESIVIRKVGFALPFQNWAVGKLHKFDLVDIEEAGQKVSFVWCTT